MEGGRGNFARAGPAFGLAFLFSMTKLKVFVALIALASIGHSQQLPDAPLPQPKQSGWTRWDGQPARTNYDVIHDRQFQWFTVGLIATTVWDIETTHAGIARHNCVEGNPLFGQHPSRGELYLHNGLEVGATVGLGFLMEKMLPADRTHWHKAEKVAHWIYPAMATYGMQLHTRGALSWYGRCW